MLPLPTLWLQVLRLKSGYSSAESWKEHFEHEALQAGAAAGRLGLGEAVWETVDQQVLCSTQENKPQLLEGYRQMVSKTAFCWLIMSS